MTTACAPLRFDPHPYPQRESATARVKDTLRRCSPGPYISFRAAAAALPLNRAVTKGQLPVTFPTRGAAFP